MSDFRKLGVPFLLIFISALVTRLISTYLSANLSGNLIKIIIVVALCVFGATLNASKGRRNGNVYKKLIAILIVIFLLFMQFNLFTFASVSEVFNFFGVDAFYINMLYIFCGYLFVD
ncbi:hypothetical protein M2475_001415 [Breznakia sp. PF5-3]|uniref:amino acid permease n=1 Tax=unclassified Breznakia TaxID=2623764 RepID=UPI0024052582|nr:MULTISPECIES: amino acid permease [unclassified Breznakia]MDF9824966.1 hypothetical protein [Breznakia sp. PM6-1]MDF9835841.1 hypothetical protein [Breznakia sp. PF5-3]MDF9836907.1 hypothetical protein [Breznakia sp. PFB2-8]MDF9859853.1 hypothetical protein [Breznakia sp. PH5-24]